MQKLITTRFASTSIRTRAAVMAAGLGATAALGAGVALATDHSPEPKSEARKVATSVQAQADNQRKGAEAEKKAAADRAKGDEAAKKASRSEARTEVKAAPAPAPAPAAPAPAPAPAPDWVKPVDNYVVGATYGKAGSMWTSTHSGQDLVVPTGTPVKAVHSGTVVKAGPNGGGDGPAYGNAVVIRHDNGTYTQYAHNSVLKVSVGQTVATGQVIALSGSTGNSSGPHLHFEVRTTPNYGSSVEPLGFLRSHGVGI
ncbi:M23 family metallopeptidase [Streptomyces sp. LX-29]|uniref:M23 family metallopeptidase n=1 Tax=Streptomyces sp. LX-29 TaxID=2900152 RepID=UPI00240DB1D1|nr:M23 family metallopeptidase [Streptomyces sp. LX-29]WFB11642.1 M23 family metallopeptidase [Streptomyces sp. LX-29]